MIWVSSSNISVSSNMMESGDRKKKQLSYIDRTRSNEYSRKEIYFINQIYKSAL